MTDTQSITVGEMKSQMAVRVREVAEVACIEVNSTIMWPICAMDPFIEACVIVDKLEKALNSVLEAVKRDPNGSAYIWKLAQDALEREHG